MLYRKPKGSAVGSGEGAASESTSEEEAPGETAFTVTKRRRVRRSQPLDQKKKKKMQRTFQTQDIVNGKALGGMS